ncbi:APC family permease [Actinoplanes sp. NPDC051859]|uniref:APC family permease n=1 Tax=Actinoplanes sp. NPDC051859 TaxID=3363909 RepID=UPI0037A9EEB3
MPAILTSAAPPDGVACALARARLGVAPLVTTVMAAAAPLTVVAGGASAGFAVTGSTGIPLAYLVVAAILAIFAVGYTAMARQIVNAGSFYSYIAYGLGRLWGIMSAFVAVTAYAVMMVGLYGGFGVVAAAFAKTQAGVNLPWSVWAMLVWAVIAGLGGRRIDLNSRILAVLLIAEVALAIGLAAVHVTHPGGGTVTYTTLSPIALFGSWAGAGAALVTGIAGFVGFEATTVYGEEARDPQRTVPRSTYLALAVIGVLYAGCAWAMSVATGPQHIVARATTDGSELIFTLAAPHVPGFIIVLGHLLFITSLFAATLAFHNTGARYLFALGRESVLPRILGSTSPRTKAPLAGSLIQTGIGLAGITVYAIGGWDPFTRMFFWLTVLGGLGVLFLMTATSLAVMAYFSPRLRRRHGIGVLRGVICPAIATLLLGTVAVVTLSQFATLLGVEPASSVRWQLPTIYAAVACLGVIWGCGLRVWRRDVYAQVGRGATRTATPTGNGVAR